MNKRLLDYDPTTGTSTYHYYDPLTDKTTIQEVADLEPLQRHRHAARKDEGLTKNGIKGGQWLYAQIHPVEQTKFLQKYGFSVFENGRSKEVMRILNTDPDFQLCKMTTGTHA